MFNFKNPDSIKSKAIVLTICAVIFVLIAIPFRYFFPIFQVSELRPASALPPVFGMMFGPWGALGAASGNLIADIIAGYPPEVYLLGFIPQFLYGYISYKLWYSLKIVDKITKPRINTVWNLIKFLIVIFITSTMMSVLLGTFLEALNITNIASPSTLIIQFNNFEFSMIFGILIITLANFYKIKMYEPKKTKKILIPPKVFDILLISAIILGAFYAIYSSIFGQISNNYMIILTISIYLMALFYIFKPIVREIEEKKTFVKISLTEKIISFFIIIGAIIAILVGIIAFFINPVSVENIMSFWEIVYLSIALVLGIFYIFSIIFLWYIEKGITTPIESLSQITDDYTSSEEHIKHSEHTLSNIKKYTKDNSEIGILAISLKKMVINLEKYMENLKKVTAEKERINTELDIAKKIQSSMLPNEFPAFPEKTEIDVRAMAEPAKEVGGDFYDFFLIDDDHLAIVIADVSGKGIPAALFMVIAKTLIKNDAQSGNTPEKVFINVNNQLCEGNDQNMFVTAWMGVLEISTGKFTFVNAGHDAPILKEENTYDWLKSKPGFVLGGMEDIKYSQNEICLKPKDRIFLYTDGITEAINKKEEQFGEERLFEIIKKKGDSEISKVLNTVKNNVDIFVGDLDQFDDITMLILEYKKK